MALHEDVLEKAREEVDRVVGPSHLPGIEYREQLPYLELCVLQETYRWACIAPLGQYF